MQSGDRVEDFELPDMTGTRRRLSEFLATGPVVLFFYPAAMTKGCTAESCHFRDLGQAFVELGAQRVGISPDTVERQARFSERYRFDYPLLSDPDGTVARRFGVRRNFGPLPTRRQTFVIGPDQTLWGVVKSEIRMKLHADDALKVLRAHAA